MSSAAAKVLVVGATGATGKHVVQQLLDKGHSVKVIVRSEERMRNALTNPPPSNDKDKLMVTEANLLDLTDEQLQEQVKDVDAVVSCLGHNLTFQGMYRDGKIVTQAVQRLTKALAADKPSSNNKKAAPKFLLMGSDGVANPSGTDDVRPFSERLVLSMLRWLVPPHSDNEGAADYLYNTLGANAESCPQLEWVVVRPTDLVDDAPPNNNNKDGEPLYVLYPKPVGSLFGGGATSRSIVATFMVDLVEQPKLWDAWKYQMPVVHNIKEEEEEDGKETKEEESKNAASSAKD